MAENFAVEEFEKASRELENPDLEGYEFFVESHDVKIYRQYNEVSGLYQYKIYGTLADVQPDVCAQVYMDIDYRKSWDTYVNELREVELGGDRTAVYWQVNFPFPLANRDYVYVREYKEVEQTGQKVYLVLAKGVQSDSVPERSGVVRVNDYVSYSALTSDGNNGSKAFMKYYDNPGGNIPTWLINWGAKTGVPTFLSIMQKACRGYPDYVAAKGKPAAS